MAFSLLSSAPLTFSTSGIAKSRSMTYQASRVVVDNLSKVSGPSAGPGESAACEKFVAKLENLLLLQPFSDETKRKRLSNPMDCEFNVDLFYGALSPLDPTRKETGYLKIYDRDDCNGPLNRLARVCGGYHNLEADVKLDFGVKDDRKELDVKTGYMLKQSTFTPKLCVIVDKWFDFPQSLIEKWDTKAKFTGTITLNLIPNGEALHCISVGGLAPGDLGSVNKNLLEKAGSTGDVMIIPADGVGVPCHKIFLIGQSAVFTAMFRSDMKEARSNRLEMGDMTERGVRALLAYLYCQDIKEPATCSNIAAELLVAADKYGFTKLYGTMKDLILIMDMEWLTVAAALKLAAFGKNKVGDSILKEIEKKARTALKSKSADELKQCAEFREHFSNPDSGIDMCCYLLQNK